jgi:DNA-binding NtrC family response regulator
MAEHIRSLLPNQSAKVAVQVLGSDAPEVPLRDLVGQRVRQVERDAISRAMAQASGNKAAAARQLGIDYKTFRVKLKAIERLTLVQHDLVKA